MLHLFKIVDPEWLPADLDVDYVAGRTDACWFGSLMSHYDLPARPDSTSVHALLRRESTLVGRQSIPGYHLTFSAPKGVSLVGLLNEDSRIVQSHEHAVLLALTYLERQLGYRITKDKITTRERVSGVIAGVFHRCSSRAGDPHLHSKVILFNRCVRNDGRVAALDMSTLVLAQQLYGIVYRTELARQLDDIGYRLNWHDGMFDLVGVNDALKARFSSRQAQIEEMLKSDGVDPHNAAPRHENAVAQVTAPHLRQQSYAELVAEWRSKSADCPLFDLSAESNKVVSAPPAAAVDLEELHESLSAGRFGTRRDVLIREMLAANEGQYSAFEIADWVDACVENGTFIEDTYPPVLFTPLGHATWKAEKIANAAEGERRKSLDAEKSAASQVKQKQTATLRVRLTPQEHKAISECAKRSKRTQTDLVRAAIIEAGDLGLPKLRIATRGESRNFHLRARLSKLEKDMLAAFAVRTELPLGDIIRGVVFGYVEQQERTVR